MRAGRLAMTGVAALGLLLGTVACCCGVPRAFREGTRIDWPWRLVRGSGNVVSERRDETGFTTVALRGLGQLALEQGEAEFVRIEAEENVIPYLETEVEGSRLIVGFERGVTVRPTRPVIIRVTVVDLDGVEVSGSGDVEGPGLEVGDISLVVTGSGDITLLDLSAEFVEARISGSGGVALSGSADGQDITISGSGAYRARDFETSEAEVRISGSGEAVVNVRDRLDATVSGSGSVNYIGTPSIESSVSGSGSIRQIED